MKHRTSLCDQGLGKGACWEAQEKMVQEAAGMVKSNREPVAVVKGLLDAVFSRSRWARFAEVRFLAEGAVKVGVFSGGDEGRRRINGLWMCEVKGSWSVDASWERSDIAAVLRDSLWVLTGIVESDLNRRRGEETMRRLGSEPALTMLASSLVGRLSEAPDPKSALRRCWSELCVEEGWREDDGTGPVLCDEHREKLFWAVLAKCAVLVAEDVDGGG